VNGWIKLHRKLLKSAIFDNPRALKVWVWCLLRANHKPAKVMVGHQVVHLEAGEFITGSHKASKELGIPVATLWRYLETLEELKMVERKSENKYTVLKVVNWGVYQGEKNGNGKQMEDKRKTNGNQTETDNNDKNEGEYAAASLFENASNEEREILAILKSIPGWQFDYEKDLQQVREVAVDYPRVDMLAEAKLLRDWLKDNPLKKNSKPRARLRNWIRKADEFGRHKKKTESTYSDLSDLVEGGEE